MLLGPHKQKRRRREWRGVEEWGYSPQLGKGGVGLEGGGQLLRSSVPNCVAREAAEPRTAQGGSFPSVMMMMILGARKREETAARVERGGRGGALTPDRPAWSSS